MIMNFDNICKLNFLLLGVQFYNEHTDGNSDISKENLNDKDLMEYLCNILENYEV